MSKRNLHSRARAAIEVAQRYGFCLVRHKRHLVFRHPSGAQSVTSLTTSDRRSLVNFEHDLRRKLDRA